MFKKIGGLNIEEIRRLATATNVVGVAYNVKNKLLNIDNRTWLYPAQIIKIDESLSEVTVKYLDNKKGDKKENIQTVPYNYIYGLYKDVPQRQLSISGLQNFVKNETGLSIIDIYELYVNKAKEVDECVDNQKSKQNMIYQYLKQNINNKIILNDINQHVIDVLIPIFNQKYEDRKNEQLKVLHSKFMNYYDEWYHYEETPMYTIDLLLPCILHNPNYDYIPKTEIIKFIEMINKLKETSE